MTDRWPPAPTPTPEEVARAAARAIRDGDRRAAIDCLADLMDPGRAAGDLPEALDRFVAQAVAHLILLQKLFPDPRLAAPLDRLGVARSPARSE